MRFLFCAFFVLLCDFCYATDFSLPYATVLVDADTNKVIYQKDGDEIRYPASLVKMMTIYIAFSYIAAGKLKFNDIAVVSKKATNQERTRLGLKKGEIVRIYDLICSMIVLSANDSSVVLAERISGNVGSFVKMMNYTASRLNMKNTHFVNPNGLHDDEQFSTAKDMALLSLALYKHFPDYFHLFSLREFKFRGRQIKGHNYVLMEYPGAFGIKTGFVSASGYNVSSIALKNGKNLLAVAMHVKHRLNRDNFIKKLLDYGFEKLEYDAQNRILNMQIKSAKISEDEIRKIILDNSD